MSPFRLTCACLWSVPRDMSCCEHIFHFSVCGLCVPMIRPEEKL